MEAVLIAGVLLSAAGQAQAGQQAKASYQAAANTAMVQGKSQSLNARKEALGFKKAGTEHLVAVRRNLALINASSAAGGLDSYSGSVGNLMDVNLNQGSQNFAAQVDNSIIAAENAKIAEAGGRYQASVYRQAGRSAAQTGMLNAAGTLAGGAFKYYEIGAYKPATGKVE